MNRPMHWPLRPRQAASDQRQKILTVGKFYPNLCVSSDANMTPGRYKGASPEVEHASPDTPTLKAYLQDKTYLLVKG